MFLQRLLFIACSFLEQAKHTQHTRTQHIMAFLASKSKTNNRSNSCNRVVVVVVSILPIMVVMFLMSKLPSSRALQTNLRVVTPRAIMDHTRTSIRFMTIKHFDTTTTPTTTPTNPIPDDSNIIITITIRLKKFPNTMHCWNGKNHLIFPIHQNGILDSIRMPMINCTPWN